MTTTLPSSAPTSVLDVDLTGPDLDESGGSHDQCGMLYGTTPSRWAEQTLGARAGTVGNTPARNEPRLRHQEGTERARIERLHGVITSDDAPTHAATRRITERGTTTQSVRSVSELARRRIVSTSGTVDPRDFAIAVAGQLPIEAIDILLGVPTAGHWQVCFDFPTGLVLNKDTSVTTTIDRGRMCTVNDPEVRAIAEEDAGTNDWLREDLTPAATGSNCADECSTCAGNSTAETSTERKRCLDYYHLLRRMIDVKPTQDRTGSCH